MHGLLASGIAIGYVEEVTYGPGTYVPYLISKGLVLDAFGEGRDDFLLTDVR